MQKKNTLKEREKKIKATIVTWLVGVKMALKESEIVIINAERDVAGRRETKIIIDKF